MDDRRERGIRLLDAIMICINEHPIVGQWITEILDRKTEPNYSEKPNNCETCRYESLASYEGACDDCTDMDGRPTNYEPKTEPLDKDTNVRSKEPQTDPCDGCVCDDGKHLLYCMNCKGIAWKTEPPKVEDEPQTEREGEWIPCSERLPEEHEWVGTKRFGTTISDKVHITFDVNGERFVKTLSLQNGELSNSDKRTMDTVFKGWKMVAWMPLPKPWEGADDE